MPFIWQYLALSALALFLLPFFNARYNWQPDISAHAYLWGIALLLSAGGLRVLPVNSHQETMAFICLGSVLAALAVAGVFFELKGERYETTPPALKIAELMGASSKIAYYGSKYHGQFHFTGRLTQPIEVVHKAKELSRFVNQNPTGYVVMEYKAISNKQLSVLSYQYPYKNHTLGFISSKTLIDNPRLLLQLKPS